MMESIIQQLSIYLEQNTLFKPSVMAVSYHTFDLLLKEMGSKAVIMDTSNNREVMFLKLELKNGIHLLDIFASSEMSFIDQTNS